MFCCKYFANLQNYIFNFGLFAEDLWFTRFEYFPSQV